MAIILKARNFLEAQRCLVSDNIVYQDNQSAMLLEKNDQGSSSQRNQHIDIWYFFIANKIKDNSVNVVYCPTKAMLADFFTKPLQGALFRCLQA